MKFSWIGLVVFVCLVLSGCGGNRIVNEKSHPEPTPATHQPETTKRPGGYYLDDGPGDNPPADINSIPDAIPKPENLNERANKPYSALGFHYTPMTEYQPYKAKGLASWYGKRYHGQKTSTGEVYDMYGMTGAHTTLPIPSYARVTNPENGKSVVVRINDRGPFHSDRIIDLSYAAAYKLGLVSKGSGIVEVESIDTRLQTASSLNENLASVTSTSNETSQRNMSSIQDESSRPQSEQEESKSDNKPIESTGFFVQVGAFKQQDNADALSKKLLDQQLVENAPVKNWYNDNIYKVRIGPFSNRQDAEQTANRIKQSLKINTYIIIQP